MHGQTAAASVSMGAPGLRVYAGNKIRELKSCLRQEGDAKREQGAWTAT
jgi:hypothetical protein